MSEVKPMDIDQARTVASQELSWRIGSYDGRREHGLDHECMNAIAAAKLAVELERRLRKMETDWRVATGCKSPGEAAATIEQLREQISVDLDAVPVEPAEQPEPGEIAPCPWCGSEARLSGFPPDYYWVVCRGECAAAGPTRKSAASAVDQWNRLSSQKDPSKAVARLRDMLEAEELERHAIALMFDQLDAHLAASLVRGCYHCSPDFDPDE